MKTKASFDKEAVKERTVMGIRAMDFILHGTESWLEIITPLGQRIRFKSNFIGFDEQQHIFFTLPNLSKTEYHQFFIEGFNVNVEGLLEKNEGALVCFRSQIEHVIYNPLMLLVLSVPKEAKLFLLRDELRYQLKLSAEIQLPTRKLAVVLTDVSPNGCGFRFNAISPVFEMAQNIVIEISNNVISDTYALSGAIKNSQKKRGRQIYGLAFDEPGKANCRRLLAALIYDGSKYIFKEKIK